MAKLVKLPKSEQIVDIIKKIKTLKGDEVIFELPHKADLFKNPHNLSLIRKSALAMGKTVILKTPDPDGQSMIAKAGLLLEEDAVEEVVKSVKAKAKKVKFSDIGVTAMPKTASIELDEPEPEELGSRPARIIPRGAAPAAIPGSYMPSASKIRFPRLTSTFSKYFVLGAIVLVLLVFGASVLLPQAHITVYARSEPVSRDIEVSVDQSIRAVNSANLTIPGQAISREISHTRNFPATGVKLEGTKATGNLQLYNFTKNTLTLRAATTTLVVDGKKYYFTKDVTGLRPTARIGQGPEQEIDNSSLIPPIQIIAAEPGSNYNIGANVRMEVQNSALGQADVYGMTAGTVSGGSSTETKVLSQQDLDKATAAMQAELAGLAEKEIASSGTDAKIKVLPNAVQSEVLAKTANKEVGDVTDTFDMTIIARVTGLSFNEEDVKALMVEKINSVLSEDKYLPQNGKQMVQTSFKSIDLAKGIGVLAVHYETVAAYKVENTNLSRILAGKDAVEIKEILLTKPEIDRVDVQFSPFFVNRAPRWNGKIYIQTVQS
jgi:hypothetical protein